MFCVTFDLSSANAFNLGKTKFCCLVKSKLPLQNVQTEIRMRLWSIQSTAIFYHFTETDFSRERRNSMTYITIISVIFVTNENNDFLKKKNNVL